MYSTEHREFQDIVVSLEKILDKFDGIERKSSDFQKEMELFLREMTVTKNEIRLIKSRVKQMGGDQTDTESMRTMVSNAFENLFTQMSQIVNSARKNLLDNTKTVAPVEEFVPNEPQILSEMIKPAVPEPVAEELEPVVTNVAEPLIEETEPVIRESLSEMPEEPPVKLSTFEKVNPPQEDNTEVIAEKEITDEVHETLKEIARTLVQDSETDPGKRIQTPNPLNEISALLKETKEEVCKELLGGNTEELAAEIPLVEPPELLKQTLTKVEEFGHIDTEDLGQEEIGTSAEDVNELLKKISSSCVAGIPE
jgi:hypothetical protein